MSENLEELAVKLESINRIREELVKLNLNIEGRLYFENEVYPLLEVVRILSFSSSNISVSASNLNTINSSKNSKIKDAVELVYDLNDLTEEAVEALEKKIATLIAISSKCKDK